MQVVCHVSAEHLYIIHTHTHTHTHIYIYEPGKSRVAPVVLLLMPCFCGVVGVYLRSVVGLFDRSVAVVTEPAVNRFGGGREHLGRVSARIGRVGE